MADLLDRLRLFELCFALSSPMLSDREAEEIARGLRGGVRGPLLLKWIEQLLADRQDRIRLLDHLRKRLSQAFRYLDTLARDAQRPTMAPTKKLVCPRCRKPYVRAAGLSPNGTVYFHADRTECRMVAGG